LRAEKVSLYAILNSEKNQGNYSQRHSEVVVLDVLEEEAKSLGFLSVVLDGNRGGGLDLAGGTFFVVLAVTDPFTELNTGINSNERHVVGLGEGVNKLGVLGVFAISGEDDKHGFLAVNSLANLVKALNET
jgi:hypothetical protein